MGAGGKILGVVVTTAAVEAGTMAAVETGVETGVASGEPWNHCRP